MIAEVVAEVVFEAAVGGGDGKWYRYWVIGEVVVVEVVFEAAIGKGDNHGVDGNDSVE